MKFLREPFNILGSEITGLDNRILDLENKTEAINPYCRNCGVYFKAGTGKNINWTNIYHSAYGPGSGTYHYCSWCHPNYDRTEFSLAIGEKDPSWKYFKCEEVARETQNHES